MPKITALKQQANRPDRYSVFLDGKYVFSLSADQVLANRLAAGDELSQSKVEELAVQSDYGKALQRCYNLISFRPRSTQEVRLYLHRKQYEDDTAEKAIQSLQDQDLLNDTRFARDWVEDRRRFGFRSIKKLQQELRQKGIADQIVKDALAEVSEEDESDALIQLISEKNLLRRYPDNEKLTRHLAGKGFSYSTIKAALKRLENN